MSATFTEIITLEKVECGGCGGIFALSSHFIETKKRESGGFTCPYCSEKRGWWTSRADELKKELELKMKELTAVKCEVWRERGLKEAAEKKVHRATNGVCTCCNRSFVNLQRHMKTKHPEITKSTKKPVRS